MYYKDFKFKRVISEKRCMFTATRVYGIPLFRKEEIVDLVLTERWSDSKLVDVTNNLRVPSKYTVGLRDLYEIAQADAKEMK